jgi:hypothetical protein
MNFSTFRKLGLLFLIANVFAIGVNAQIKFGVKVGFSVSEILTSPSEVVYVNGNAQVPRYFPVAGFQGGLLLAVPLSNKLSLQPEVGFSAQGTTNKPPTFYTVSATENYNFDWVNIPLLLKYKLPFGFFVETGPQLGLLISANIQENIVGGTNVAYYNVKSQYKSSDFEWVLGTGFLFPYNIGLDVRYNLGLSNFSNGSSSGTENAPVQSGSIKNSVVQVSVFYLFGKYKAPPAPKENE